jgi:hypothetical protein
MSAPVIAGVAKVMLLLLLAIYKDGSSLDAEAFVGPANQEACEQSGAVLANEWKAMDSDIDAVIAECSLIDDPREILKAYHEAHPKPAREESTHTGTPGI